MRDSVLKAKLSRGEPVLATTLHFTDPSVYELASLMGFDALWMDLEHHGFSVETACTLMRAARVGSSDIIARPAKGEFMRMGRLLEAGAQAIMYPRCDSAAEAAEVVRWSKFASVGERGVDAGNADNPYCTMPVPEYLRHANENTVIIIQIESPKALDEVEAIARVPGVDIVMLGPGDFSILAGIPCQFEHPLIAEAIDRIAAACASAGKHWGTVTFNPEHCRMLQAKGAKFLCHGADLITLKRGLEQMQAQWSELGFTFDNRLHAMSARLDRYR
jgi:4-hydroxy-2-oxoheptanedioate aldolase